MSGYLRKKNSANRWQKRYFEIVANYWVYYKSSTSPEMLCAMDLWKAGIPELVPLAEGETEQCEFSITWDRYRLFRASNRAEAVRWVNAIKAVQAQRPSDGGGGGDPNATRRAAVNAMQGNSNGGAGSAVGVGKSPDGVTGGSAGAAVAADWGARPSHKSAGGASTAGGRGPQPTGGAAAPGSGGLCGSCSVM